MTETRRIRVLLAAVVMPALAGCGSGSVDDEIVAEMAGETATETTTGAPPSPTPPEPSASTHWPAGDRSGLPGYPALYSEGCTNTEPIDGTAYTPVGWMPINQLAQLIHVTVEAKIIEISPVRISSIKMDSNPGGPEQAYFRLATVEVVTATALRSRDFDEGEHLQLLLGGAGPEIDRSDLCYGFDGQYNADEVPLRPGDRVFVAAEVWQNFPIPGLVGEVLFLPVALSTIWKVEADRTALSAVPQYTMNVDALNARITEEARSGPTTSWSREPTGDPLVDPPEDDYVAPPSTVPPPPPGIDHPNTPTVPGPPPEDLED